jgi:hypothetical protein
MPALCLLLLIPGLGVRAVDGPVRFTLSGVLGQSQPTGTAPLPFIGSIGLAIDTAGKMWTSPGGNVLDIFSRRENGPWMLADQLTLPAAMSGLGLRWDGASLFVPLTNGTLYRVDPLTRSVSPVCPLGGSSSYGVAPASCVKGFAVKGKVFVLEGELVKGYAADGTALGTVLTPPRPAKSGGKYCAIGVEPVTGDLLLGTPYADMVIYRFTVEGAQLTTDGWPRPRWATQFTTAGTQLWTINAGGGAGTLPPVRRTSADDFLLDAPWSNSTSGVAQDARGEFWLATAQGIMHYATNGSALPDRIGGVTGVRAMAISSDGTLITAVEGGGRMLRLSIADDPTMPFQCNSNEPWRAGGGWRSRANGMAWDGTAFLVLDEVDKLLWQYDPWHTAWGEKPWSKITEPGALTKPRALALGDADLWVLDGGKLLEAQRAKLAFHEVVLRGLADLSAVTALAAAGDERIVLATNTAVSAFTRTADGQYQACWTSPATFTRIAGLTLSAGCVVVADQDARTLTALSLADGNVRGTLTSAQVAGGMQPVAITASRRWILVADEAGKRLLRLKLTQ